MRFFPLIIISLSASFLFSNCQETSTNEEGEAQTSSNARIAAPMLGPGTLVGDLYVNEPLQLELPIIQGWETGNHAMVEEVFSRWDPTKGIDSLPSMFLLNVGRVLPPDVQGIRSHYFLQIEPASYYPMFGGDPATYLAGVGEQLTTMAGQEILNPVYADTLGNRQVQRMDVAFQFGEFPGKQTYYTWFDQGLFVNLVFTYENDEDWNLIQSAVLDLMHLD